MFGCSCERIRVGGDECCAAVVVEASGGPSVAVKGGGTRKGCGRF